MNTPHMLSKPRATKPPVRRNRSIKIAASTINGLTQVFKMLSDESRLRILLALSQEEELHVSALCDILGESQPAVSHHLTLLRMAGLVGNRRDGKHNFYRLESGLVAGLLDQFFNDTGNGRRCLQFEDFSLDYKKR